MRRRLLAALVLALLITGYVIVRDADRSDARFTIVSGPPDPTAPVVLPRAGMRYRVQATTVGGPGHLRVQVGTYLQPARDTLTFTVLDARRRRVARCVFPPSGYVDNQQLSCAVSDLRAVRSVRITRTGNAKIAVTAHDDIVGYFARDEQGSLLGRVSTVLSRIATPLPNPIGSVLTIAGLFGSVALTVVALLVAWRRDDDDPEPRPERPGGDA